MPCKLLCHIGVADDSALYQRTRPNVPEYLNFLLAPCHISIDLSSKILLHLLLMNFYTRACTHANCQQFNSVDLWTCGPCGPVDLWTLWTCGPVDLWTLWTCGPSGPVDLVDLWACGPSGPVDLWTLWTCGPCGPVGLWTCGPVDLWTCGPSGPVDLWTYSIWRPDRTTGGHLFYSYMRRCYVT